MTEKIRIYTSQGEIDSPPRGSCALALGTFDGVHIAHSRLLESAKELKAAKGCQSAGAWCFSSPPSAILNNDLTPQLTSTEEKIALILDCGIDFVAVADFTDFKDMSAEDFVGHVLMDYLGCVCAVCGFNHRFGAGGRGDAGLLESLLGHGNLVSVSEVTCFGETVSSTAIREHISLGNIEIANAMLGRPFSLTAKVVEGKHLGRRLQFPTANMLFPKGAVIPHLGIYATVCRVGGKSYIGVSNVGVRPTVTDGSDSHSVNCETYIVDFSGDIYGSEITVEFHKYLRREQKFDSLDSLKAQIERDKLAAIEFFG